VPEALLDDLRMDASLERQSGPRVPETVKREVAHVVPRDSLPELVGDDLGVERLAGAAREHQTLIRVVGARGEPLL
jgi:hypothetical protein